MPLHSTLRFIKRASSPSGVPGLVQVESTNRRISIMAHRRCSLRTIHLPSAKPTTANSAGHSQGGRLKGRPPSEAEGVAVGADVGVSLTAGVAVRPERGVTVGPGIPDAVDVASPAGSSASTTSSCRGGGAIVGAAATSDAPSSGKIAGHATTVSTPNT